MITISPKLAVGLKVLGFIAIVALFSVMTVTSKPMLTAYSQLQLNADTICVLNPEQCDEARQQEFNDAIQRGMQEAFEEEYEERTGEELPTVDEFMEGVEEEGDFDDERLANEAADNGIEGMQNMPSATILNRPDELIIKAELLNATFNNLLRSTEEPEIEIIEEAVDMDEDDLQRQVIQYEFAQNTDADNIGIYTLPNQTVQSLASSITSNRDATDIEMFENGRMIISYEGAESFDEADDTTIYAPHNYASAAGYIYDNSTIYEPDGTELFENAQTSTTGAAVANVTEATFQSTDDSFRVQVPDGWIAHDINNIGSALSEEARLGYGLLAQLCSQEEPGARALSPSSASAASNAASNISCQGAQEEMIHIIRYPDLDTRLLATSDTSLSNNGMTTADNIVSYQLQKLQEIGYRNMHIITSTDIAVNLVNAQMNQIITTVPAKLLEMTYSTAISPNETRTGYFISTASDATAPNTGSTKGYGIFYEGNPTNSVAAETTTGSGILPPPAVGQVFDSFELIAAPEV